MNLCKAVQVILRQNRNATYIYKASASRLTQYGIPFVASWN